MTIGIICAIPEELAHLRNVLTHGETSLRAGQTYDHGTLDGHSVILVAAGIGKVNTALTATLLIDRFDCRLIVFSGVAGGLDPSLHVGDVVVADRTIQHDAGVIQNAQVKTYQAGHVPYLNPTDRLGYAVDAILVARLRDRLQGFSLAPLSAAAGGTGKPPSITFGTILSGDQFMNCEATRMRLHRELGGAAIEMEGGALGQVCEAFGVPWLDIRALSDLAGAESHFDFSEFVDEVAARSAAILRHVMPVI